MGIKGYIVVCEGVFGTIYSKVFFAEDRAEKYAEEVQERDTVIYIVGVIVDWNELFKAISSNSPEE